MIGLTAIREMYRYNRWANRRVFDVALDLAPDAFVEGLGSSYPSVRDTLTHIVWAEWLWLERWRGVSSRTAFDAEQFHGAETLCARWEDVARQQAAFLEHLSNEQLQSPVAYVSLTGQTWTYPLWRQMYHVVNHSTYHRGQVTTMLRQLHARPVSTDFLVYHDELDSPTG